MAARSVTVILTNESSVPLWLSDAGLSHGEWDVSPPAAVNPGLIAAWTSQSDGFLTGTQGWANFNVGDGSNGTLNINWDNPYYGGNSYSCSATPPYQTFYWGGNDSNAIVCFAFRN